MNIPITHELLGGLEIEYVVPGAFTGGALLVNGEKQKGKRGKFIVTNQDGTEVEIKVRSNLYDTIPKVEIQGESIHMAEPLKWYQYLWMCLPILIVLNGGALGVLIGLTTVRINISTFRSTQTSLYKYLYTGIFSLLAFALFASILWQLMRLREV